MMDVSSSSPVAIPRRTDGARQSQSSLSGANTFLFWAILIIVAISPLPFGSARPIFWGVWAAYVGIVGIIYFGMLTLRQSRPRIGPGALAVASISFILTCAYLIFQMVPIGEVPIITVDGVTITAPQISVAPGMTLLMLIRMATFGLLALLAMQVASNDARRTRLLQLILLTVLVHGIYALVSLQMGDTILGLAKWAYSGNATGTFVNRNSFATFAGFGAILAVSLACSVVVRQSGRHSHDGHILNYHSSVTLYGLAYAILLVVLVATQSRMGLFATLVGTGVVLAVTALTIGKIRMAFWIMPLGLVLLVGAIFLRGGGLLERIESQGLTSDSRLELYWQTLDLIGLRPWTGFGGGSFELAFPLVHQAPLSSEYLWDKAHSTYLTLWAELGLIVGTLPILALAYLGFRLVRALIERRGSWTAQTAALGVLVLGAVHSLVDFSLEIQANTIVFLLIVSIGAATTIPSDRKAA